MRITPVWNSEMTREQLARVLALLALHRVESGKATEPTTSTKTDATSQDLEEVPDEPR